MRKKTFLIILMTILCLVYAGDPLVVINGTYLGNEKRNYYGNVAPSNLETVWKTLLGHGITSVGYSKRIWRGCGWTGQPVMTREGGIDYIYQSSFDHTLKKIKADSGQIVWEYKYPDVIKGTGTIWRREDDSTGIIILGSRRGPDHSTWSPDIYNFRGVDLNGREAWRYHMKRGASYSVDVDASALMVNDTAYIGLENGYFLVFDPDPDHGKVRAGHIEPDILEFHPLYHSSDKKSHGYNIITEASPSRIGDYIYISSGSGHVYGYNMKKRKIDWDFFTGADMDGSTTVSYDNCILVTVEQQYIDGKGGVFKLDPSKPADSSCVVWYFPTGESPDYTKLWDGGVVGTASVSDLTRPSYMPHLAAFIGVDGYLYLVEHDRIDTAEVKGPNNIHSYNKPHFVASRWVGPGISTPLIVGDKIIACSYSGISLFQYTKDKHVKRLGRRNIGSIEATPFVFNKKIYIGTRSGFLYCLGK